jgi:prepilin peptidase CpaA
LIGFGTLFLLWILGGGGAGDVKLMGALGVWLGARMVTQVLFVSVLFVWLAAVFALVFRKQVADGLQSLKSPQTSQARPARHMVAFAIPVGLASWIILLAHVVKSQAAG